MSYTVVCPDIDPLTSAATDFFQQLGTGESTNISIVKEFILKFDRNWFLLNNVSRGTKSWDIFSSLCSDEPFVA